MLMEKLDMNKDKENTMAKFFHGLNIDMAKHVER